MSALKPWVAMAITFLCLVPFAGAGDDNERPRPDLDVNQLTARWSLHIGGSFNTLATEAAWSPDTTGAAIIILENALGLDEQVETFNFAATLRLSRRHSFEVSAIDLRRSATRTIEHEVEWGDAVFRAQGSVGTDFSTTFIDALWKYDFSDSARLNTGFMAGFSVLSLGVALRGEARLEGGEGSEWVEGAVESADVLAPLPVVGFYLDYALSQRWLLRFASSALIEVSIGGHRGRLRQMEFSCEYVFSDLFGVGLGVSSLGVAYEQNIKAQQFAVSYSVRAVDAYLSFAF